MWRILIWWFSKELQINLLGAGAFFVVSLFYTALNVTLVKGFIEILLGFLSSCRFYRGPHDLECLKNIWLSVGCTEEGWGSPESLSAKEIQFLNKVDLK